MVEDIATFTVQRLLLLRNVIPIQVIMLVVHEITINTTVENLFAPIITT
jgi:hypothetical protein